MPRKLLIIVLGMVASLLLALPAAADNPHPSEVYIALEPGDSFHLDKEVTTPEIPPVIDICLVEDETGSFADDIATLQALAGAGGPLITALDATGADYATCVIGYRDFAQSFWGSFSDHVYRRLSDVTPGGAGFVAGVPLLTAGGGADFPEAQLEALHYLATPGHACIDSNGNDPGVCADGQDTPVGQQPTWRAGSSRVVLLTTDASCHVTGDAGGWPGDAGTTSPAVTAGILSGAGITVIGLTPGGAGTIGCVDTLAAGTGGSVHPTGASGDTIVAAILAGLAELTTDVWWEVGPCDGGLTVTLSPTVREDVPGDTTVTFEEWIDLDAAVPVGTQLHCTVTFIANEFPAAGATIGVETIWVTAVDIDIKPFSFPNSINRKSMGLVPVAILSGPDFDATTEVDLTASIDFGPAGANPVHLPFTAAELASHTASDVDGNGIDDLVLHFRQKEAGIAAGDTSACLTFTTTGGVTATACDSVRPLN